MKRKGVPQNKYERFRGIIADIATAYEVWDDVEIRGAMEILMDKLAVKAGMGGVEKRRLHSDAWKFYEIFKRKHLEFRDAEYYGKFGAKEIQIIKILIGKLNERGASTEEYVAWLFDEFYEKNTHLSASIPLSVSSNVLQDFMWKSKEILDMRLEQRKKEEQETHLEKRIRVLIRKLEDVKIIQRLRELVANYDSGTINLHTLEVEVNKISEKVG